MKVSFVLPDLRGGGAERVSIDLARAFADCGHQVDFVLMTATGDFLPEVRNAFRIFDLAAERTRDVAWPLARYLRQWSPDAVVAMMWPLTALVPFVAALAGFRGKLLVCEHAMLSQQYANWGMPHRCVLRVSTALGYRLASARVAVSNGAAIDMARMAWLDPTRIAAIHNPVRRLGEPSKEQAACANVLWGSTGSTGPRILSVGSLKPVKNQALLLKAFAQLPRPDAQLMLLGGGQNEGLLRRMAKDLGIEDRVIFAGFKADPSPLYATADLFVLSSDHEGFGNVIVEALFFGLPVVSTDCPTGPSEILEKGRWGKLVPVGDPEALSRAMDAALSEPVNRDVRVQRAAQFSPEIAARKYLNLLGFA